MYYFRLLYTTPKCLNYFYFLNENVASSVRRQGKMHYSFHYRLSSFHVTENISSSFRRELLAVLCLTVSDTATIARRGCVRPIITRNDPRWVSGAPNSPATALTCLCPMGFYSYHLEGISSPWEITLYREAAINERAS